MLKLKIEPMANREIGVPERLYMGAQPTLIIKKGAVEVPANFRPIACLNTQYKFLTQVQADFLHAFMNNEEVMSIEQGALRRQKRGTTTAYSWMAS